MEILFYEIANLFLTGTNLANVKIVGLILNALGVTALFILASLIPKSEKAGSWLYFALIEISAIWFTISFFTFDSYKVFMTPAMIAAETGDVASGFGSTLKTVLTKGLPYILLFQLAPVAVLVFNKKIQKVLVKIRNIRVAIILFASSLVMLLSAYFINKEDAVFKYEYNYNEAIKHFGMVQTLFLEAFNHPETNEESEISFSTIKTEKPAIMKIPENKTEEVEETKEYGFNVMSIDFDELADNENSGAIKSIHKYVAAQEPSRKNKYTGIFKGKNLILITAEAFTKEVIDPKRTPTLYRLATRGIVFEDFYQPAWGGSTSTGEYSFLTGLVPTRPDIMFLTPNNNMFFTLGNQLQRLDYDSWFFHNGDFDYYGRDYTHPNLGYSNYLAKGKGLNMEDVFPASDLEMMEKTVDCYIDSKQFSVYYMTISGHANYSLNPQINAMAAKNRELVDNMTCGEKVKAYYACNQELEYAMEYLIERLEEKGIADDTVIALVADHYPYGLCRSTTWDNSEDSLGELYGYPAKTDAERDHSAAILWCGSLEKEKPIIITDPSYTLDLVPTLSNLFGLEYDSRLLVGRDVLSDAEPIVLWNNHSWKTDKGYFNKTTGEFTPDEEETIDEEYIARISAIVNDKKKFSENVVKFNYYGKLFGKDDIK